MTNRTPLRLTGIALLLVAAAVALAPLFTLLAVDSCLDDGGSFDYETYECDFAVSHPAGAPRIANTVFIGGGIVLALIGAALVAYSRRK